MIAYMDRDFNFIRVNRAYAETNGHKPEFFVGKNHFDLYPDKDYDDPDLRTAFFSDRRKGKRIIRNVEKGYFPGQYEKKDTAKPQPGRKTAQRAAQR